MSRWTEPEDDSFSSSAVSSYQRIGEYVTDVLEAWNQRDGDTLRYLFLRGNCLEIGVLASASSQYESLIEKQVGRGMDMGGARKRGGPKTSVETEALRVCLTRFVDGRRQEQEGDISSAFGSYRESLLAIKPLIDDDSEWILPILYALMRNVREVAMICDENMGTEEEEDSSGTTSSITRAIEDFRTLFAMCNKNLKLGCIDIVNQIFRLCFHINNLQLCESLINTIEKDNFIRFDKIPVGKYVIYAFFRGRYALVNSKLQDAEKFLEASFTRCHRDYEQNKRHILFYLLAVKLLIGSFPKEGLLQKYGIPQFIDIVRAMKTGNIGRFESCLEENKELFIRSGIYLTLGRSKVVIYRNLLKKTIDILETSRVPLSSFQSALRFVGEEIDLDEVECIVANLIFNGYVQGYISHKHRLLVVKKDGAFPPLRR